MSVEKHAYRTWEEGVVHASVPQALGARPRLAQQLSPSLMSIAEKASALLGLNSARRAVRSREEIVTAGRRCDSIFLIREGMAIRYRILRDGQRQILNFLLSGDFGGVYKLPLR
jgi:CRP-like cAMP-binding protein